MSKKMTIELSDVELWALSRLYDATTDKNPTPLTPEAAAILYRLAELLLSDGGDYADEP